MNAFLRVVLSLVVVFTIADAATPVMAGSPKADKSGRIEVHNQSDAWVWITAYDYYGVGIEVKKLRILGTRCVGPHTNDVVFMNGTLYEVRGEVTHKDCAHPVMLNQLLGWDGKTPYYVTGSNGKYRFAHTP